MTHLLLDEWRTPIYCKLDCTVLTFSDYEINRRGELRNIKTGHCCKLIDLGSYPYYHINGYSHGFYIHVILMSTFVGLRPPGMIIDHINQNKKDYRLENLRYITKSENNLNCKRNKPIKIEKDGWIFINQSTLDYVNNLKIDLSTLIWKKLDETDAETYISNVGIVKYKNNNLSIGRSTETPEYTYSKFSFKEIHYSAHRLVAKYFLNEGKDIPENMVVDHINMIRWDNRVENLRICTASENMKNPNTNINSVSVSQVKCQDKLGNWYYFSSFSSAAKYIKGNCCSITEWISGKSKCSRKDFFNFQLWDDKDLESYKNGNIKLSDDEPSPLKVEPIGREAASEPIKAKYKDGNWYYFISRIQLARSVDVENETLRLWLLGKKKCSFGFSEFRDWEEKDWENYYSGNLEICTEIFRTREKDQMRFPIKALRKDGTWEYYSGKWKFSKAKNVSHYTVDNWFSGKRNCSIGYTKFEYWSEQDHEDYKNGKIKLTEVE